MELYHYIYIIISHVTDSHKQIRDDRFVFEMPEVNFSTKLLFRIKLHKIFPILLFYSCIVGNRTILFFNIDNVKYAFLSKIYYLKYK